MNKLFVHGFPGLYGGAGAELYHQIPVWQALGLEVHLIPTRNGWQTDPLYPELKKSGIVVHSTNQFDAIDKGAPILGFCSQDFLRALDFIRARTEATVFVNCMTWLFAEEKQRMSKGHIRAFLYQNEDVRKARAPELRALNRSARCKFMTFVPYFDQKKFPFIEHRTPSTFGMGRMSRQDQDKYAGNTLYIYDHVMSPRPKVGLMVGFTDKSRMKIGKPAPWIITAKDHRECSQRAFYKHCEIVLQPTDTTENWPRVGLEAMSSGSVLVVDDRGGWQRMIQHKKTGFLCKGAQDFIFYSSLMAYEPELRSEIAKNARRRGEDLASMDESKQTWKACLEAVV